MDEIVQFGIVTFREFLSESFEPRVTEYGTDTSNSEWKRLDNDFYVTYFKHDNNIFVVLFRLGHVGFGVSEKEVDLNSIKTFTDLNKKFNFTPRAVSSAMKVFNIVIYVIQQGIKQFNPKEIYFNGSTSDLQRLYSKLIKDKSFIKIIDSFGYEYINSVRDLHTFKRKL